MKKIIVTVLVACMLVLSLASCTPTETASNKFPTLTYLYNTSDGHKAIGEYLQRALQTVGITMNLENQEWATFLETRKNGDYNIARNGWIADYSDPICFIDMWTSISGNNDVQFGKGAHADLAMYSVDLTPYGGEKIENGTWAQTYDVLVSKIKSETDATKRFEMMHIAEDMLMDTGCIMPLYFYTDLYMISKQVTGFYSNPLGYKYFHKTQFGDNSKLNVCLASEPQSLDPALNSAVDGATLLAAMFSGLAKWDQDASGKLIIVADAAKELVEGTTNDDGTVTYVYTLKDNMKWSNGEAVKASDFEYAWKRAASTALGADYGYMFEVVKGYGEEDVNGLAPLAVVADDAANTLTVTLANAVAYWNELLAFPTYFPVYKPVIDEKGDSWATEPETYVSNGVYKMTGWAHKSTITLTKNADHIAADEVTMNSVVFYLSDDANTMLTNFKKGDWQLIDDVPVDEIDNLKKDYPDEFVIAGQIGTYYVCVNINKSLLPEGSTLTGVEAEKANQEIRKALSLLFDRNYIVNEISKGGQVPASSFVAMGMFNPDGTEFYKTKHNGNEYFGYYDVSEDAFESNCQAALEILKKYYDIDAK